MPEDFDRLKAQKDRIVREQRAATLAPALSLARRAVNSWACYAKRDIEHREIAALHREIDEMAGAHPVADSAQILSSDRSTSDRPREEASSSLPSGVSYMICALCSHTKYSDRECLSCVGLGPVKAKEPMMTEQYDADGKMMFLAADGSMMCETHPGREWPHDDCAGPGMPWIIQGRTLIEETLVLRSEAVARRDAEKRVVHIPSGTI